MSIGDTEIKTQERAINFFKDPEILGYQYIGNLSDYQNKNIKEDRLRQYLRLKGYAEKLIDAAVMQLQQEAGNLSRGVYDANKTVYSRLKYGIPVSESPEKPPVTVELIDEANPLNNDFAIAEEVTVVEQQEKRPDLVIYLNGIAVAVIELKRSSISVSEGIRQNLTNQKDSFIRGFFTTMQFCMAGNESEGLRYGTLLTGEKFYMEWKDDGFKEHEEERDPVDIRISETCAGIENKLLKQIYAMFDKERFIDLIMNFVVFDKGIKKVCRYNQYFGIKRTQQRLNNLRTELHNPNRDPDKPMGGILWHTQGSGKTLTMVWLAKWILTHWAELNARILIVTDRDELDEQIEKTFTGVDENIARTKSGIHIEQPEDGVIAFDVIASCDVEMPSASHKGYFNERWLKIHCQVTLGIDMSGFRIMSVGNCEPQEESDNDRLSGELVPIISRDQFEDEAEKFLTRYCPEALDKPMRVPIETIASDMKLQVIEDVPLSDDLTYFGTIIFDKQLKEFGFKKHGRTLHRFVSEDISQVINFQCGQPYRNETHLMWVNIGIRVPESFERKFEAVNSKKYYHEYECNIRTRLGMAKLKDSNKATTYDLRKSIDHMAADIVEEILDDVLPVFEILNSRESIIAHRREYPWFDTLNFRLILLEESMIYGHMGDKKKAKKCFEMYYRSVVLKLSEGAHIKRHLEYLDKLRNQLEW